MQVRVDLVGERGSQFVIRGRGVDHVGITLVLGLLLWLFFAGCVKVTTGATDEERVCASEDVASRIRAEWAEQTRNASQSQRARLLHSLCLKVSSSYIEIGYQTVEKWRTMEEIKGDLVAAEDIKKMLDEWILTEQPVFAAYDDNIRYTFTEIESSGNFEREILEALRSLVKQYEKVTAVAFSPSDSPADYEYILEQLEYETERIGQGAREVLNAL